MSKKGKTPSLEIYKRYDLEEQLLSDESLSHWFADLCAGKQSSIEIDEVTLALMEERGLVRKIGNDLVLAPDGRQFARKLGLIPGPSKFEIDPSLIEKGIHQNERELSTISDGTPSLEKIWENFIKTRDEYSRNLLMEHYRNLVQYTADRLHSNLPDKVEMDDLVSAGIFGLMDAIDSFDPSRGVKFETYCSLRIRDSMLDELPIMDSVARYRARAHELVYTLHSLKTLLERMSAEKEITKELGMSTEAFTRLQRHANLVSQELLHILEDEISVNRIFEAQRRDLKSLLTKGLTRAERLIIVMYYYEEMTMKQIGEALDLSESRVSQIHSSVIARLKAQMKKRESELDF